MAGKRPTKLPDGTWTYPNSAAVLDKVGLKTIAHYIGMRRQHIASYIVDKPIFQTCMDGVRRRGSGIRQFWWAQSMDLEMARAACIAGPIVSNNDGEEYAPTGQHPAGVLFSIFGRTLILLRAASRWGEGLASD
jgi:hypothetical protein